MNVFKVLPLRELICFSYVYFFLKCIWKAFRPLLRFSAPLKKTNSLEIYDTKKSPNFILMRHFNLSEERSYETGKYVWFN